MIVHQAIIEDIDRMFTDSLGNWTGDGVWEDFIPGWAFGVASLILAAHETDETMALEYPHINITPGKAYRLHFGSLAITIDVSITLRWQITDGTYFFSGEQEYPLGFSPMDIDEFIDIPDDFNPEIATLEITAHEEDHENTNKLCTKFYSLTYETIAKVQYLPIMGVG